MKNEIKTSILLITVVGVFGTVGMPQADATNWNGRVWDDDVRYKCVSVSGITKTSNVNLCSDLNTSSNYWEFSGSDLTITPITSGSYEISVYGWTSGVSGAGKTFLTWNPATDEYYTGYVAMNKNLSWEDSTLDTSSDGYDWKTATGHEFGHVAGLSHLQIRSI